MMASCFAESNTIIGYLATKHHADTLYPTDPVLRADVEQWMELGEL